MLTVVTHTNPNSGRDLSRCIESVKAALPPTGARHVIINVENDENSRSALMQARWDARELDEYICFVDDDDYISQDSLIKTFAAIRVQQAGVAFTNEVLVDKAGKVLSRNDQVKMFEHIPLTPLIIHHLAIMKTSYLTDEVKVLADQYTMSIEWIMKARCALEGGAIHVPIDGYFWVQHDDQHHKITAWQEAFRKNCPLLTPKLRSWAKFAGPIPQYK